MKTKGEKNRFRKDFFGETDPNRWDPDLVGDAKVREFVEALADGDFELNEPEREILAWTSEDAGKSALKTWRSWNHSNKVYERKSTKEGTVAAPRKRVKEEDLLALADDKTKAQVTKLNDQLAKILATKEEILDGLKEQYTEVQKKESEMKKAMAGLAKLTAAGLTPEQIIAAIQSM